MTKPSAADSPAPVEPAPAPRDARTTPSWARPPALLFLAAVILNFAYAFTQIGLEDAPAWSALGAWKMFTYRDLRHTTLEAEALIDGEWRPIDLEALFPSRWDSGPRYSGSNFIRSNRRMAIFADSTCQRHPDHPQRIRLTEVKWPVTLGQREQPRKDVKLTERLDFVCGVSRADRPKGTVW